MSVCWDVVKVKMAKAMLYGGILGMVIGAVLGIKRKLPDEELTESFVNWAMRMFALSGALVGIYYTVTLCTLSGKPGKY